jgi:hypothetical protein
MQENPRLRSDLVILPVEIQGERMLFFQDPGRWCEELVFVPIEFVPILQYFTGALTVREIQENLMRETGELVESEIIEKIAEELDAKHLLDSANFRNYISGLRSEWDKAETRPALLAGQSYPAKPEELKKFLDQFYTAADGPGLPSENHGNQLKAVIAPHIDLGPNGACYAYAYKRLVEESQAELFVILGTAHSLTEELLVFCSKDFATPLGIARTDRDFIEQTRRRLRKKSHSGDFSHRREHSIELQVIFLQHAMAGKREFQIVPVMVSGFSAALETGESPAEDVLVKDYIRALREQINECGKKVCLIASADLAHLGPKYGDQDGYLPLREQEIKDDDEKMLGHLLQGDGEGFFAEAARIKDRRRICGLAPIYLTCKLLEPFRAELLKWSVAYDTPSQSAVSFCAMALY